VHRDVGQVAEYHAAVVGGGEAGIGRGQLMSAGDHREPEALRGLAAQQRLPPRHRLHHPVVGDHHGVGRGHRDPGRVVHLERGHAVRDDPLIYQRPGGVVQQHAAVARSAGVRSAGVRSAGRDRGQRRARRVRPGHAALDDGRHLPVRGPGQHGLDLPGVPAGHHHEDLVDAGRLVEGRHAPLDQRPAAQAEQLLRHPRAEPLAHAAAEHHRDHPHEPDSTRQARGRRIPNEWPGGAGDRWGTGRTGLFHRCRAGYCAGTACPATACDGCARAGRLTGVFLPAAGATVGYIS
jgi:hypothetical protein